MFETSGFWLSQQDSPLESSAFRSYMNAPVNIRQHEVLPASVTPYRMPANTVFNDFRIPGWPEKGPTNRGIDSVTNPILQSPMSRGTPDGSPSRVGEKSWTYNMPCPRERKFLIFDKSGNKTRLMFSSLCPVWNPQLASANKQFDAFKFFPERQARKGEQMCTRTPNRYEESGENEIADEEHEDTEEINALLYSNDYDDQDNDCDDDEVSSGHSPLVKEGVCHKQEELRESDFDDEVSISSFSLKRCKTLDCGKQNIAFEEIHSEDFFSGIDKGTSPTIGSKRPRNDKIRDTLKVVESLLPGLKSKDPIVILDEAINYLKCLKHNAETMSVEDSNSSGCYEPLY